MSFKKFKSAVTTTAQKAADGTIPGILSVTNGESAGEVVIRYRHERLDTDVSIRALAQDANEYPDGNTFLVWTDDSNAPPPVVASIEAAQDYLFGMSVFEMVASLASHLDRTIRLDTGGDQESTAEAEQEDDQIEDSDDDYDAAYDTDYPSDGDEFGLPSSVSRPTPQRPSLSGCPKPLLDRIRRDLRQVKQAGYKVGLIDAFGKKDSRGIVSVSIRTDKLALSEEAMEAWDVKPTEYIVLLFRFEMPYAPLESVMAQAAVQTEVTFRIGKCSRYKPSPSQAVAAFSEPNLFLTRLEATEEELEQGGDRFQKLSISASLDQFLCGNFVSLLKLREAHGIDWEQANELLLARIGLMTADDHRLPDDFEAAKPGDASTDVDQVPGRHHVLGQDHLLEGGPERERSFPLIAMQFAMRYFVRCTKYCLRCHRRLEEGFEALRPYVCSDPLCLFQYMAMGFGPSVEHEILTEPYVVDLLVSLCYAAIQPLGYSSVVYTSGQTSSLPIRTLPVGLRLRVPHLSDPEATPFKAKVSTDNTSLVFEGEGALTFGERIAPAKWLAFRRPGHSLTHHAVVREVNFASKTAVIEVMGQSSGCWGTGVRVGYIAPLSPAQEVDPSVPSQPGNEKVEVFFYDADFDSLDDANKGLAMRHILDTLPSILEVENWLTIHPHKPVRYMDRISPAAASLLQWIVSSNRSCIFQVDRSRGVARRRQGKHDSPQDADGVAGRGRNREHERVLGMDGWVQFRFAQGSPDKELRFNRALQEVAARKAIQEHPTIFAWHGSSLANWHSIVRTGLDFKDIRCGRAYGNGVYFSPHFHTSITYSGVSTQPWPNSDLDFTTCLSLNEIINAPDEFVSRTPHYVVSQLDWHQCRYLFIRTPSAKAPKPRSSMQKGLSSNKASKEVVSDPAFYPQPPGKEVIGVDNKPLLIPLSAIPLRTIGPTAAGSPSGPTKRTAQLREESEDEDAEDIAILFTDDEFEAASSPPSKKTASRASSVDTTSSIANNTTTTGRGGGPPTPASINPASAPAPPPTSSPVTDFHPGALDLSTLPRLAPPSFATDAGTRALGRELKRLQDVQSRTPLPELGWYIDFDAVSNLYHWVVELHSFDLALPLARDMRDMGVGSIVLEVRFGPDFPFAPPFVRVVRPRFVPFLAGGGGHVTAGGAMCMELLTSSGWSPANSMESVFLQVRVALCSVEPRPARLEKGATGQGRDYGVAEAVDAFVRAANVHGWAVPEKLKITATGV